MGLDHESALLASVLHGQHDWFTAAVDRGLEPEHFSFPDHQAIWRQACLLVAKKGRWGLKSLVATALQQEQNISAALAAEALGQRGPSFQVPDYHVEQILTDFWKVELQRVLAETSAIAKNAENVAELQEKCREGAAKVDSLSAGFSVARQDNGFLPVFTRTLAEMETQLEAAKNGVSAWIKSGVPRLDQTLGGGFQRPGVYTFCAMSGRGKTHLGVHFALEAARSGASVVYFTVEMPQTQIMRRMVSNLGSVKAGRLSTLDLTDDEFDRIQGIPARIGDMKLAIEDKFRGELTRLQTLIRNYRRAGRLDFAVVDYVQQVTAPRRYQTKQQEMLHVAHELKQSCIDEGIVMLQLAQANRDAEKSERAGEKLHAGHLEHSHAIYENSDAVTFFQNEQIGPDRMELLWVAKNRHGMSNIAIPVHLDFEHSRLRGQP